MAKFLNPKKLITAIDDLFLDAEEMIVIVSPFIKLDKQLKSILHQKQKNTDFEVFILYGKNESNHALSLGKDDLDFFKDFSNVYIHYNPDLHAKYYANERRSILTSLNLHSYSIENNIEVGVMFEQSNSWTWSGDDRIDDKSFSYFMDVIEKSTCVFQKTSKQEKRFFGLVKGDIKTTIEIDKTNNTHRILEKKDKPSTNTLITKPGFCIRTGKQIEFNLKKPFSNDAYLTWKTYENHDYPEKYCHFSGEKSNGETSFAKPILYKHYKKAMEYQKK